MVVACTSGQLGQVTLRISSRTSCRNCGVRPGQPSTAAVVPEGGSLLPPPGAIATSLTARIALPYSIPIRSRELAGGGGFEPPHPVLGTGGLPLKPPPLTLSRPPRGG